MEGAKWKSPAKQHFWASVSPSKMGTICKAIIPPNTKRATFTRCSFRQIQKQHLGLLAHLIRRNWHQKCCFAGNFCLSDFTPFISITPGLQQHHSDQYRSPIQDALEQSCSLHHIHSVQEIYCASISNIDSAVAGTTNVYTRRGTFHLMFFQATSEIM